MKFALTGLLICPLLLGACSGDAPKTPADSAAPTTDPPPPALVVTRLKITDETPPDLRPAPLMKTELEAAWQAALSAQGLKIGETRADAVQIRIEAQVVYGLTRGEGLLKAVEDARAEARWAVRVRLRAPGEDTSDHRFFEGDAGADFKGDAAALKAALRTHMSAALAAPAAGLKSSALLMTLTPPQLIRRLTAPDAQARIAAIGRLGTLRATAAVEPLSALAKTEADRAVRLRIIGALAEIGDDGAAKALISMANPRDREMLRAVVNALSVVGGERVTDFLDILSVHDAPDVRDMVETARKRLARTARKAAP